MQKIIIPILALFLFAACEETIELDLKQTDEVFIIEGSVSSQDTFHTVKVSKTVPFGASGQTPRVSDALVTVTDDEGTIVRFEEVEAGLYGCISKCRTLQKGKKKHSL